MTPDTRQDAHERGARLATHPTPADDAMYQDGYATAKGMLPRLEDAEISYIVDRLADVADRPAFIAGMHAAAIDHLARLAGDPAYAADHAARVNLERSLDYIAAGGSKAGLLDAQLRLQREAARIERQARACPECDGRGYPADDPEVIAGGAPHAECPACDGTGGARITAGQHRNRDNPHMPHCPVCSEPLIHLTIGRDNWAYCDTCRVRLDTGSGWGHWREDDNDLDRARNRRHLEGYRDLSDDEFYGPGWGDTEATR